LSVPVRVEIANARDIPLPNLSATSLLAGERLDVARAEEDALTQARRDAANAARLAAEEGLQLRTSLALVARDIGISVSVSQEQARAAVEAAQAERELDAARRAATNSAILAATEGLQSIVPGALRRDIPIPRIGVAPIGAIPIPQVGVAPIGAIPLPNVDVSNDAAREFIAAAEATRSAGEQFQQSVIVAGAQFTASLIDSIRSGDIGGAFQSVLGLGGQLAGAASSFVGAGGALFGLTKAAVPGLGLAAALLPILGGIFGSLFSPRPESEATRAIGASARGAPAVEFNLTQNNSIAVNGMPEFRDALTDSVTQLARVIETNLIPRITRLEANA
jgi:hypothetical protein